jgi:hypothetical protein
MERRKWIPNVTAIADQLIEDYRNGDDYGWFLDALHTIASWQDAAKEHGDEFNENDWTKLVIELVKRAAESRPVNAPASIHVDYNPDHEAVTFDDTNGQPILFYRPDG